jgi:hypothetical protein
MCVREKKKEDPVQSEIERNDPAVQKLKSIFAMNEILLILIAIKLLLAL